MDIHKPKPWHGARELLKEIGTIVIGVLIALGAEQAVEALHTRHIIHEAEAAMRTELVDDDLQQAYVRQAITPCLEDSLQGLRQAIAQRGDPQRFAELARAYHPQFRTWEADAWRATLSSAASGRMESKRLLGWSGAYVMVPMLAASSQRELEDVERLHRTRYLGGAWTGARADELNDLVDELQDMVKEMTQQSHGLLSAANHVGIGLTPAVQEKLMGEARGAYGACVMRPDLSDRFPGDQAPTREQMDAFQRGLGVRPR